MTSFNQLRLGKVVRTRKNRFRRAPALRKCPQRRGVVSRISVESPRKPNSAKRKIARVRLSTGKRVLVKIPGPGIGNIAKFSPLMMEGGRAVDVPGVRLTCIRGLLGANPVLTRRKRPSKYGLKRRTLEQLRQKDLPLS